MPDKPQPANPPGPAEAIGALRRLLADPRIEFQRRYVGEDLADLHLAFPADADFTNAVLAVAQELQRAFRDPANYGVVLQHQLVALRRGAFPPLGETKAVLRLVIRPIDVTRFQLIAFRHRHHPPKPYYTIGQRIRGGA